MRNTKSQYVKDVLVAIKSVKIRATAAIIAGDMPSYNRLMGDLVALEVCLVIETEKLMAEMDKEVA